MAYSLVELVTIASRLLSLLIIVRAVISWVSPDPRNAIVAFVYRVTEPLLAPVRNLLPAAGGIDFSPLVVLIAIQVIERLLVRVLIGMA
jgi:YggT family protein